MKAKTSYARCVILVSFPIACPLCGTAVKPMETHICSRPEPRGQRRVGRVTKRKA